MGITNSVPKGPHSKYIPQSKGNDDYIDPRSMDKTKRELFELFKQNKICHVSLLEETETKLQDSEKTIENNKKKIDELNEYIKELQSKSNCQKP